MGRLRRNKERKGKGEEACSSRLNNLARAFPSCRRDIPTPSLTMLLSTLCLSLLPLLLADRPSFSPPYPIDPLRNLSGSHVLPVVCTRDDFTTGCVSRVDEPSDRSRTDRRFAPFSACSSSSRTSAVVSLSSKEKVAGRLEKRFFRGFSVGEEGEGSVVIKHGCVNRRSRKSRLRVKSSILEIRGSRWTENRFAKSGVGLSGSLLMTLMGSWGGEGDQETVLSKFWISTALLADEDMDAAVVRGKRVGGVSPPSPATLFKSVAGRMPG